MHAFRSPAGCFDIFRIACAYLSGKVRLLAGAAESEGSRARCKTAASFFSTRGSPEKFHFNTARILCTGAVRRGTRHLILRMHRRAEIRMGKAAADRMIPRGI